MLFVREARLPRAVDELELGGGLPLAATCDPRTRVDGDQWRCDTGAALELALPGGVQPCLAETAPAVAGAAVTAYRGRQPTEGRGVSSRECRLPPPLGRGLAIDSDADPPLQNLVWPFTGAQVVEAVEAR